MNDPNVRELLALSQTNVTSDPIQGYAFAIRAYNLTHQLSLINLSEPTARGEAAAKAGFRAEQANLDFDLVCRWIEHSLSVLPNDNQGNRERVASYTLGGRALSLHGLKVVLGERTLDSDQQVSDIAKQASNYFRAGELILSSQHDKGARWDRYAAMHAHTWAIHEAALGDSSLAAGIALTGLWRSIRAANEYQPNTEH